LIQDNNTDITSWQWTHFFKPSWVRLYEP